MQTAAEKIHFQSLIILNLITQVRHTRTEIVEKLLDLFIEQLINLVAFFFKPLICILIKANQIHYTCITHIGVSL